MAKNIADDQQTYEEQKRYKREESSPSHKDGQEFPSSHDVATAGDGALRTADTELPDRDGAASDVEETPARLHGSLHGRWNASGEAEE